MIQFESKCGRCRASQITIFPTSLHFTEEVRHNNCIVDVGGSDSDHTLRCAIEVWQSHKTTNIEPRMNIQWVEVKADDVLDVLDLNTPDHFITLRDYRHVNSCLDSRCISDGGRCMVVEGLDMKSSGQSTATHMRSIDLDIDMKQLAIRLGYLRTISSYACSSLKMLAKANFGIYNRDISVWKVYKWNKNDDDIPRPTHVDWSIFLEKKQCIRCCRKRNDVEISELQKNHFVYHVIF